MTKEELCGVIVDKHDHFRSCAGKLSVRMNGGQNNIGYILDETENKWFVMLQNGTYIDVVKLAWH